MGKKIFVILVGLLFVGIGIYSLISDKEKAKRCTQETSGTIVELKKETSEDSDGHTEYVYYPIIRYTAKGNTITKKSNIGSSNYSKYRVNEKVTIFYNPNKVEEFMIEGENGSKFIAIVFISLGSLVTIVILIKREV